ncbi:hypothetical protein NQ318_006571 [Aromia moschata]|uniref:Glycosyltransferase n=1 Tax=Aromia moschata TaxID=1265417 RepID=A0AAV8YQB3_9CUCU|nr:hypothetical protein NQ318_006571 [Aromia moschata]
MKKGLTYPINVARNIAKLSAQTYFVFPSDIELYPTRNFIQKFFGFVKAHPDLVLKNQSVPENKTQLQEMFQKKQAILFHQSVCSPCHEVPDGENWLVTNETEELEVFSVGEKGGSTRSLGALLRMYTERTVVGRKGQLGRAGKQDVPVEKNSYFMRFYAMSAILKRLESVEVGKKNPIINSNCCLHLLHNPELIYKYKEELKSYILATMNTKLWKDAL